MRGTRIQDLKAGDTVVVDGGFDCMHEGSYGRVHEDQKQGLYIRCAEGRHYLDGQVDEHGGGVLIGIRKTS